MSLGFNSQLRIGGWLYHVQTEDRGLSHPFIDTLVFAQGQVLHRHSTCYEDLLHDGIAEQEVLQNRVERQHSDILEALRAGSLPLEKALSAGTPVGVSAIELQLVNPGAWLVAGNAHLEIRVSTRENGRPVAGAEVDVFVEGVTAKSVVMVATDVDGCGSLDFPLPTLAEPNAAALVIRARHGASRDELRYHLKPKPKPHGSAISPE